MPRFENEPVHGLENGKFTNSPKATSFRGETTPANFRYTVKEDAELTDGQIIGHTTDGLILRWLSGLVASVSKNWRSK